jgi:hypothetical protein
MEDRIEVRNAKPHEAKCYKGHQYITGKLQRVTEYALLTRRRISKKCSITVFAANHSQSYEGACRVLTLETELGRLLEEEMGFSEADSLPQHFQVLLRVEMVDFDEQVVDVEYVAHRIYPDEE